MHNLSFYPSFKSSKEIVTDIESLNAGYYR